MEFLVFLLSLVLSSRLGTIDIDESMAVKQGDDRSFFLKQFFTQLRNLLALEFIELWCIVDVSLVFLNS